MAPFETESGTLSNVMTLYPYLLLNTWVFDDERTGLKEEAFVLGMTEMISAVIQHRSIPDATRGFDLLFSASEFDGYDVRVTREYSEGGGNWYRGDVFGHEMRGWLCPALFRYFEEAPDHIYMKAEPLSEGVDPVWDPQGRATDQFEAPR
jgi:hypothetical protein